MCTVCFAKISLKLEGFSPFRLLCRCYWDAFRDFVAMQTVGWQPTLQAAFSCKKPRIAGCNFCCTSLYRTAGCITAVLNRRNATVGSNKRKTRCCTERCWSWSCTATYLPVSSQRLFGVLFGGHAIYIAASSFFSRTCQALLAASFASWDILGAALASEVSGLLTYFRGPLLYGLPCWDMPQPYGLPSVPGICQILYGLPFFLGHAKCLLSGLCFC